MEAVLPVEETLEDTMRIVLDLKVELDKPVRKNLYLDEYRTVLQDDNLNFMGLSDPKEISYLNFAYHNEDFAFPS